jgi:5-enolpyruvylshikimate-3-phosphate synthase
LKIKETDRINALIRELGKMGFRLKTNNVDTLEWDGAKTQVPDKTIETETYRITAWQWHSLLQHPGFPV